MVRCPFVDVFFHMTHPGQQDSISVNRLFEFRTKEVKMNTVKTFVTRLFKDESGAGMVEYSLLVALIGVVLVGTLVFLQEGIGAALDSATTVLNAAPVAG